MPRDTSKQTEPALTDVRQSLVALIKQADRAGANALLDAWAARHGYEEVFKVLLEPALIGIGESITGEKHTLAQAYVAASHVPSWNYGIDALPDTSMYNFAFDFSGLGSLDTNWSLTTSEAVELVVQPEDQVVNAFIGFLGRNRCLSAVETVLDVWGVMQGHTTLFMQADAATNLSYRVRTY